MKLFGWSKERRFVVVRERIRETKAAVGRQLLDVPGYTFRVWVTNRSEGALELWRDYNGRACVEQRIEELKHDLAADGFCLQPFFATEAAFLAVLFTFNLLSLYQHQTTPDAPYRQPGTLRVAVFLCGAVLGVMGRDVVVKLSAAWGGLRKHKPLVDSDVGLAEVRVAEVDSARRSAGHRRRYDLKSGVRSPRNYRSTSEFGLKSPPTFDSRTRLICVFISVVFRFCFVPGATRQCPPAATCRGEIGKMFLPPS